MKLDIWIYWPEHLLKYVNFCIAFIENISKIHWPEPIFTGCGPPDFTCAKVDDWLFFNRRLSVRLSYFFVTLFSHTFKFSNNFFYSKDWIETSDKCLYQHVWWVHKRGIIQKNMYKRYCRFSVKKLKILTRRQQVTHMLRGALHSSFKWSWLVQNHCKIKVLKHKIIKKLVTFIFRTGGTSTNRVTKLVKIQLYWAVCSDLKCSCSQGIYILKKTHWLYVNRKTTCTKCSVSQELLH